jgi:hypothetical protein
MGWEHGQNLVPSPTLSCGGLDHPAHNMGICLSNWTVHGITAKCERGYKLQTNPTKFIT